MIGKQKTQEKEGENGFALKRPAIDVVIYDNADMHIVDLLSEEMVYELLSPVKELLSTLKVEKKLNIILRNSLKNCW